MNLRDRADRHRGGVGFVVGVVAAMILAGGGVAIAAIPSSSTAKFTGCVAKTGGALRVIDAQAGKKCKSSEKTISWSKGWTHRGAWAAGTAYKPGDVVTVSGSSYVAKVKSTGSAPASSPSAWGLLAAAGANGTNGTNGTNGAAGAKGDKGDPGPVTVRYASGTSASVANGGTGTITADCNSGESVLGGGVIAPAGWTVNSSGPYDEPFIIFVGGDFDTIPDDGWSVRATNNSGGAGTFTAWAMCAPVTSYS
jgi:hypothetical protein